MITCTDSLAAEVLHQFHESGEVTGLGVWADDLEERGEGELASLLREVMGTPALQEPARFFTSRSDQTQWAIETAKADLWLSGQRDQDRVRVLWEEELDGLWDCLLMAWTGRKWSAMESVGGIDLQYETVQEIRDYQREVEATIALEVMGRIRV